MAKSKLLVNNAFLKENELQNFSALPPAVKISEVVCDYDPVAEQVNRKLLLQRYCDEKGKISKLFRGKVPYYLMNAILFNEKKSVIYCSVPKTSSSNWRRLMLIFDQKIKDPSVITYHIKVHGYLFNQIKGVNPGDRKEMLTNYFKFFFV